MIGLGLNITKYSGSSPGGLLDLYPNATVAYSLRELSSDFVGVPVIRVRRDFDNAEQDFTATEISDGTLENWVSLPYNGYVTTWYDQSGNGNDAIQATASRQPYIIRSGALVQLNNKPALLIESGDVKGLDFAEQNIPNNGDYTFISIGKNLFSSSEQCIIAGSGNGSSILKYDTDNNFLARFNIPTVKYGLSGFNNTYCIINVGRTSNIFYSIGNGITGTPNSNFGNSVRLRVLMNAGTYLSTSIGLHQEYILYLESKYTDAATIDSKINEYYSIY